ncbi:MAG TPA: YicC/YloC family endoribonuclease [Gemmatimonadales bacterium]|nr:YicC/YloC family endoribonuclease [Gemmatimonadales bacterium]
MPLSMTGFGAAEGPVAGGRLRLEIRTVNHRFFNFAPKLPYELAPLEGELRERLRQDVERGHVTVHGRWLEPPKGAGASGLTLDLDRARAVADRLRELQVALGLGGGVTLEMIARQPDVLSVTAGEPVEVSWAEVEPIVAEAAAACRAMRQREGEALAVELQHRLDLLAQGADAIAKRAPDRLVRERDRLRAQVGELLDGRPIDEARLAQELAFLADKLDITEELVRFRAHIAACRQALRGNEPVGKRLGFLAQELGREVNTMGAKANDAEIAQQVIAMKGELEKFREQIENLE